MQRDSSDAQGTAAASRGSIRNALVKAAAWSAVPKSV
jgi:hypothetical protein